jgi:hypothetical protein
MLIKSATNSQYMVFYNDVRFEDVPDEFWGKPFIELAASKGLVRGIGENLYSPHTALTRAQFAGPGEAHVGYAEYNQRRLLSTWADYLQRPARDPARVNDAARETAARA